MRKMLNKKGFSLVELMIVVVIMGILIAVAIPLYGTITTNAKNKTCASNIDAIENSAVVYYTEHGKPATTENWKTELTFDGGEAPECPWGEEMDSYPGYTVTFDASGSATVTCGAQTVEGSHGA
ncbi:MAG: type II secretion system protein [Ruminococcaceae bacterium]|nr:type II secretion system protein [Oscillospiraceae bacterium]